MTVFGSMIESYNIHHHFSTPSLPLMIGIITDENDDNCGPPHREVERDSIMELSKVLVQ